VKDVDGLARLLASVIAAGYFAEVKVKGEPLRYRNNRLSACLRDRHVQSQKDFVCLLTLFISHLSLRISTSHCSLSCLFAGKFHKSMYGGKLYKHIYE
jgi:hypothetical protein